MTILILSFISIMLATFVLVVATTGRSASQQTIASRMALIHIPVAEKHRDLPDAEQLLKETKKNRFRRLDEKLEPYRFAKHLRLLIAQSDSSTTVPSLLLSTMGLFIAGYCVTWLFVSMAVIDLPVGLVLACLPYGFLSLKRSKRVNAFNTVLPECIDMLARALRAGHSVQGALEMLAENARQPASAEFAEIFRQQNLGLPLRNALLQLLDRVPSSDLRVLVTALLVQKDTGGNLVEILDRTVYVIRERLVIQGEIQVQTAQGRLTGWILTALPVVMMVMLNLVNPGYSSVLFHDPFGRELIYCCVGMLVMGGFVIRRIVNGIEV